MPVVTVRPRYEPFNAARMRPPTTVIPTAAPSGTGSRGGTRGAPFGHCVSSLPCAGTVLSGFRPEPEDLGPEDDDAEEDCVEQDVAVAGADAAAEHGLGDADHQAGRHGAARPPERREPRGDHPDQAERGAAHVRVSGDR